MGDCGEKGVWRIGLDSADLGWSLIAEFYDYGYENLDFVTAGKFWLSDDRGSLPFTQ